MQTFTFNNGTFKANSIDAWKVLYCLHSNAVTHGRPAIERFIEVVSEMLDTGEVSGPRNALKLS